MALPPAPPGRTIVMQLTGASQFDGVWRVVPSEWNGMAGTLIKLNPATYYRVQMVPTGCVEWNGDACAEVWVPEDKLSLWRAEHDVE